MWICKVLCSFSQLEFLRALEWKMKKTFYYTQDDTLRIARLHTGVHWTPFLFLKIKNGIISWRMRQLSCVISLVLPRAGRTSVCVILLSGKLILANPSIIKFCSCSQTAYDILCAILRFFFSFVWLMHELCIYSRYLLLYNTNTQTWPIFRTLENVPLSFYIQG